MKSLFLLLFSMFLFSNILAQNINVPSPLIFIYDASGSMWGQIDGQTKMDLASSVLSQTLDKLPSNQRIGLVAYGHRREKDCEDIEFLIDMENTSKELVRQAVKKIKPLGRTPLAKSAIKVIAQLRSTNSKATIILVTDGIEVCSGNLCDVISQAIAEGIDFKLHIIGFGLKNTESTSLKCATDAGEGKYFDASDAISLSESLIEASFTTIDKSVYSQPIELDKNFSVLAIKNDKPIDALVVAYKTGTDERVSSIRTYGDTSFLSLLPGKYDLNFSIVNSDIESLTAFMVESFKDSIGHNTMSFDAGEIKVTATNNGEGWDAVVKIYSKITGKVVGGSRTYGKSNITELNPGTYDVETTALAMNGLKTKHLNEGVQVRGNETTEVAHDFKSGTLTLSSTNNGDEWDSVVKIKSNDDGKDIAGGRTYGKAKSYQINPGIYQVQFEAMHINGLEAKTPSKTIEIKSNEESRHAHDFKSGILKIGAKTEGQLSDATVKIQEVKSGKDFGGGRTYTSDSSNPKEMILSPATYLIVVMDIKSGQKKNFTLVVKAGQITEQFADF